MEHEGFENKGIGQALSDTVSYPALLHNLEQNFPEAREAMENWILTGVPSITVKGLRDSQSVVDTGVLDFLKSNRWLAPDGSRPRDEVYYALGHQVPQTSPELHLKQP